MQADDLRWKQRFKNYIKALALLEDDALKYRLSGLNELEEQGLIQRFEFTPELAWKVLKDFFEYQGKSNVIGSRDAVREAFSSGLIQDGEGWMEMIKSRNLSTHIYNENLAQSLVSKIVTNYVQLFVELKNKLLERYNT